MVMHEGEEHTYSVKNTVLQLTCGPRSLTTTSLPSSTPADTRVASSSRALASPLSVSFCRSTYSCKARVLVRRNGHGYVGRDHTRGALAASVAFTSATVATSAGLSTLSVIGKPRKSVDLPVAEMVSEVIVVTGRWGVGGKLITVSCLLFIYLFATKNDFGPICRTGTI
jgi:hypothetical protein